MADNLREKLPTKDSIISAEDKVILSRENSNTTVDEFGRITFNEENFPTIFLDNTTAEIASLSSYIETTTVDKLTSFETPEILALQYKHSSNSEGDIIGIAGHAVTDINFEEHVNTIDPIDLTGGLQISKNAATKTIRDRELASADILLSPGVYRVECTGTFTLVGIAGGLDENGNIFGNGYKAYVVLELHKETQPGEILLYSTPAVEYASEKNIDDTASSVTCYMHGYISICNPSVLKLKAKTAGEYAIGTVDPDSAGDFPDTFINPVQLVFEKVCDDPFCMVVSSSENDVFPGFIPFETTTLAPVIPPPPPLIPEEDPTVTTTTTTTPSPGGSTPPPPRGSTTGSSSAGDPAPGGGSGGAPPGEVTTPTPVPVEGDPDRVTCKNGGLCTSSSYLNKKEKFSYRQYNGSYLDAFPAQAGWSWYGLINKKVDPDIILRESRDARHNGGFMGKKDDPGDALLWKYFRKDPSPPATSPNAGKYRRNYGVARERAECDVCRKGIVELSKPNSEVPLFISSEPRSRAQWCHSELLNDEFEKEELGEGGGGSEYAPYLAALREDKCTVTLTWPCFVKDFGLRAITVGDIDSGTYSEASTSSPDERYSVAPSRVYDDLEEIFGDIFEIENLRPRSTDAADRLALSTHVANFNNGSNRLPATLDEMRNNYVNFNLPFYTDPALDPRRILADQFDDLSVNEKLLWRLPDRSADENSQDFAIIYEDHILQRLKKAFSLRNTYDSIINDQDLLYVLSKPLEDISNSASYKTVKYSAGADNKATLFYTGMGISSRSKLLALAQFVSNCDYYKVVTDVKVNSGGVEGVKQWVKESEKFSSDIYSNKWWKSEALLRVFREIDLHPFGDYISGRPASAGSTDGAAEAESTDGPANELSDIVEENNSGGNCCMTKAAMIIEAFFWNKDQFKPTPDGDKFTPWWYTYLPIGYWEEEYASFETNRANAYADAAANESKRQYDYEQDRVDKFEWLKQPVDLLGIIKHPHPHAHTAESVVLPSGELIQGCQD